MYSTANLIMRGVKCKFQNRLIICHVLARPQSNKWFITPNIICQYDTDNMLPVIYTQFVLFDKRRIPLVMTGVTL